MTDKHGMPQYDGMEYEELVAAAQFLWMENAELRKLVNDMWRPASYQVTGFQYEKFKERMRKLRINAR